MPRYYHIRCKIERGGFASERAFTIDLQNGQKLVGTADVEYLCGKNKKPLGPDEPPFGQVIEGYVKCRKIRDTESGDVIIEVPSTDVVCVSADELIEMNC